MVVNEVGCFNSTGRTSFGSVPETPNIKEENQEHTITSNCMTVHMPRSTVGTGAFVLVNQLSDRYSALPSGKHKVWFRKQTVAELVANRLHTALRQLLAGDKEPPL